MGKIVRCPECGESYRNLERLEDLRDNDSICLVCNAPIEVADWDRVLASYEDDDLDDVDDLEDVEDDYEEEEEDSDDSDEVAEDWGTDDDLETFDDDEESFDDGDEDAEVDDEEDKA